MVDSWWEEFDLLRFKSGLPTRRRLRFRFCPVRKPHVRSLSQCSAAQQRSFLWPADPLVVKSCMRAASTLLELYYWGEERAREEKISRVCLANKGVLWRDGPPSSPSTVPGLFCFLGVFLCVVLFFLFFYFFFFRCSIHPLLPSHVRRYRRHQHCRRAQNSAGALRWQNMNEACGWLKQPAAPPAVWTRRRWHH